MKVIKIEVEGIDGDLEIREQTVREAMPLLEIVQKKGDSVFADLLDRVAYLNGEPLLNASNLIGSSSMMRLMPIVYDVIGVGGDEKEND